MPLNPYQKTVVLSVMSQLPMVLLLIIFFRIPGLPLLYRAMAVITVALEAALISELTGNIVQKVRANEKGIVIREVMERKRIAWDDIKDVRQVVLSPLKKSNMRLPSKLFLVESKEAPGLQPAGEWWEKKGPLANKRSGMAELVEKYDAFVAKRLEGCFILWDIDYRRPQEHTDDVESEYWALDGRENHIMRDLMKFGGAKVSKIRFVDLTYPSYVKKHGGKYASDTEHVWETIR